MFQWAIFAFVFGLLVGADNAGHLGGALGGALLGLLIPASWRRRPLLDQFFNLLALISTAAILYSLTMLVLSWLSAGSR
jgi:rhomboid protease GluP